MAETKRDAPKRKPIRWRVVFGAVGAVAGVFTILGVGLAYYNKLMGAPPTPAAISIAPVISLAPTALAPAPAPELVARCETVKMRQSLEPLFRRDIEQREARFKALLEAMQRDLNKALPPARRSSTLTPWRSELDPVDILKNGWLVNGYVTCTISNNGTKLAKDVTLTVTRGFLFTFYDGHKLSNGTQELQLGDIRPEISGTIEIFSESPGESPPTERDLKLSYSEGVGKLSFAR